MSCNRNKNTDRINTKALIDKEYESTDFKNWLGHINGKGAANIDKALLKGATLEELENFRGGVQEHLYHLEAEHGLNVKHIKGVYKFIK